MLGFAERRKVRLLIREIIFEEFQRAQSQSTHVTDGQTNRQTHNLPWQYVYLLWWSIVHGKIDWVSNVAWSNVRRPNVPRSNGGGQMLWTPLFHIRRQTTETTVLPFTDQSCGTVFQPNSVCWTFHCQCSGNDWKCSCSRITVTMQQLTWRICCILRNLRPINSINNNNNNKSATNPWRLL